MTRLVEQGLRLESVRLRLADRTLLTLDLAVLPGEIVTVMGPSGAGKSSLVNALLELDSHLAVSVSHTTRAPRGQEQDGREYWFIDQARFRSMVEGGEFFEWAEVHGNLYGSSR
jgi:guanylate kinase